MINIDDMIKQMQGKNIYIQTHNFPDPDAIASAYGLQYLLAHKGLEARIVYKGKVNHGSSYAMVKRLGIEIIEYEDISDIDEAAQIIIVDAQKGNANILDLPGDEVVCIDHHPTYEKADYRFCDIRPGVGACASLIAEYLFAYEIAVDCKVATALMYGIKIDTANLTRGVSQLDLDMFYKLYNLTDKQLIKELDNSVLRSEDLMAYATAINSIKTSNRTSFAHVGRNCPESLVASVSDFIMMLDSTDTTVVYSVKDDGIKISVRTTTSLNVGLIANRALKGIGSGGGHENMAGGFVPYASRIADPINDEKYIDELINEIEQRFANEIEKYINE